MGGSENAVTVISAEGGADAWPRMSKDEVARKLAARVAEVLAQ